MELLIFLKKIFSRKFQIASDIMAFFEHATHEFLHYLTMRTPIVLSSNFVLSHIKKEDVRH